MHKAGRGGHPRTICTQLQNASKGQPNATVVRCGKSAGGDPMPQRIDNASHWRARADEARKWADQLSNPEKKQIMLGIAVSYITLAQLSSEEDQPTKGDSGRKP